MDHPLNPTLPDGACPAAPPTATHPRPEPDGLDSDAVLFRATTAAPAVYVLGRCVFAAVGITLQFCLLTDIVDVLKDTPEKQYAR